MPSLCRAGKNANILASLPAVLTSHLTPFDSNYAMTSFAAILVALLEPDVALAVPVNQRASGLALAHEQRIATEMWDTSISFTDGAGFGINLPRIHPLDVITAIADCVSRSDNRYLLARTIDDRSSELSGRTL